MIKQTMHLLLKGRLEAYFFNYPVYYSSFMFFRLAGYCLE